MRIVPSVCCGQRFNRCQLCPVVIEREKAIARVDDALEAWWRKEAFTSADRVMRRLETFTTDDIWIDLQRRGVEPPHEPRAMAVIVRHLTKAGEIKFTGVYDQSNLPIGHGRTVKIYKVMN